MEPEVREVQVKRNLQAVMDEVELALASAAQIHGAEFVQLIRPIVVLNITKKRLDYFLDNSQENCLPEYVWRVVDGYKTWHTYVFQVQQLKEDSVWQPLYEQIQKWTYHFLCRKGFYRGEKTQHLAQEYAAEAAIAILNAHFPYDTDFNAWLQQVVIYTCCNQIEVWQHQENIKAKLIQKTQYENPLKFMSEQPELVVCWQEDVDILHWAIGKLKNPGMRQVVWLKYYGEFSSKEIGQLLNTSANHVDKLYCQAKKKLGKILGDFGYIYG